MKILIFSTLFIFQFLNVAKAQTSNAAGSAGGASMSAIAEGATSAGMGVYLLVQGHAQVASGQVALGHMEEVMGASLVVAGAADAAQGGGYQNTGNQIAATDPTTGLPSSTDGVSTAGLDPYTQGLVNQANQLAAQSGTTIPALAAQGDGGGGGGLGDMTSSLPQSVKDGLAKVAKDVSAHYNVSSVALEDGGGGGMRGGGGANTDLAAFLNSLKGDRAPASVAGLQKSLNGAPIGVAQDNIFQQITRKYQSKIAARMFLPIQK